MANKPAPRNWNDIQIVIATISMAVTLIFWNMFAGPDRASAVKRAQEQAANPLQPLVGGVVAVQPTPLGDGKILFGGTAPQTQIIVRSSGGGGGGGGAAATGGGGAVTSTKSS